MKKSKMLFLLPMSLALFSGCAALTPEPPAAPSRESVSLADSLTAKSLAENTYINDKQLSYPLTLRTLGNTYRYSVAYETEDSYGQYRSLILQCLDKNVCGVTLGEERLCDISIDSEITMLSCHYDRPSLWLNGLQMDISTPQDAEAAFGEPDYIKENTDGTVTETLYQYDSDENGNELLLLTFRNGSLYYAAVNFGENVQWKEMRVNS